MHEIDRETVAILWDTSTEAARRRVLDEERRGLPAYDPPIGRDLPRSYAARCANPACGAPIVVTAAPGGPRRYCGTACRLRAFHARRTLRRTA